MLPSREWPQCACMGQDTQSSKHQGQEVVFWSADLHAYSQRFVQSFMTQWFDPGEHNPDTQMRPDFSNTTVKSWIWLMWTRYLTGPSSSVWMNIQIDKNICSITVKAGFSHLGFVSSTWAFCHAMFAQKVMY